MLLGGERGVVHVVALTRSWTERACSQPHYLTSTRLYHILSPLEREKNTLTTTTTKLILLHQSKL